MVCVVRKGSTTFVQTGLCDQKECIKSMYNIGERNLDPGEVFNVTIPVFFMYQIKELMNAAFLVPSYMEMPQIDMCCTVRLLRRLERRTNAFDRLCHFSRCF